MGWVRAGSGSTYSAVLSPSSDNYNRLTLLTVALPHPEPSSYSSLTWGR
jgi:hypothetical protein